MLKDGKYFVISIGDVAACRVCVYMLCSMQGGTSLQGTQHKHEHDMLPHNQWI